jgi:hypothetical protein
LNKKTKIFQKREDRMSLALTREVPTKDSSFG